MLLAQKYGIEIDEDILAQSDSYLKFDINSYMAIAIVAGSLFVIGFILQWLFILRKFKIRTFDFSNQVKAQVTWPGSMLLYTLRGLFGIMFGQESRVEFVKIYGIEIFNFLNLQAKMLAMVLAYLIVLVISCLFYYPIPDTKESQEVWFKFWTGNADFKELAGFYTYLGIWFALLTYSAIALLQKDSTRVHEQMYLYKKELSKKHMLVANVAYISNVDRSVKKEELERDIAEVLGIFPGDFILFMFPTVSNICNLQLTLDKIMSLYNYQIKGHGLTRCFYSTESLAYHYKKNHDYYTKKIQEEINKPLKYSGRGVIFFYRIGDVDNFYRLNKEFRARSRLVKKNKKGQPQMYEQLLSPSIRTIERLYKVFLFRYNDIITKNLDLHAPIYVFMRIVLYVVLGLLIFFVSTPNTIIQNILDFVLPPNLHMLQLLSNPKAKVVLNLCFPLITFVFNLAIILSIEQLGRWQKFSRHSLFQSYIIRVAFIYLLLNMFVVPGFSIGTSKSLYELVLKQNFSPINLLMQVPLQENRNFFPTFVMQSGAFSYIAFITMLPEIFKNRFSYILALEHLKEVRKMAFHKQENDLYEYGYNYSLCCVMIFILAGFGVFQPIVFISALGFFIVKFAGDFIALSCYFKEQIYANAQFLDMAVSRLKFAVSVTFLFLSLKCWIVKREDLFWLNLGLSAISVIFVLAIWRHSFDIRILFEPINQLILGREVY